MRKSPTRSAIELALVYVLLAYGWVHLTHLSPDLLQAIDSNFEQYDVLADIVFAVVSAFFLFLLVRHDFTARAQANEALCRSRDELELRVQQRTAALDIAACDAERRAQELSQAHIELSLRAQELTTLLDISHNMSSTLLSRPLLEVFLDQLKIMIDYSSAIVYMFDGEGITAIAYRGVLPEEKVIGLYIAQALAPGFQEVHRRREPVIVDDMLTDEPLARRLLALTNLTFLQTIEVTRSWMGVPLMITDRVIGMLRLDHGQPGYFTPRAAQIVQVIADHATIAMENARLYEEARKVATLEERQRMARELHDSVSQALYGIALGTHAAREQLDRAPEKLQGTLDYVLALSATAVAEMRALIFELRPDSLEQEGLVAALSRQAEAIQTRAGVNMCLDLCPEPVLPLEAKEILYRIAQEALQNTAKHAQAKIVNLRLFPDNAWIVLEVGDDGIGFDPTGKFPGHYGLQSMRERTVRVGGVFEIERVPSGGALVRARIPAAAAA